MSSEKSGNDQEETGIIAFSLVGFLTAGAQPKTIEVITMMDTMIVG
jgi:hypothetical protein